MSDRAMQEFLAQEIYMMVRRNVGAAMHPVAAEDVRPAFALALEALEREGLIPGKAPELREVGEVGALAELRAKLEALKADADKPIPWTVSDETLAANGGRSNGLWDAIEALDRIAAKHRPSPGRLANDLQEALRLQGVHLGPDATEAVVKALESLDGGAQ